MLSSIGAIIGATGSLGIKLQYEPFLWVGVLTFMFPICYYYGRFKSTRDANSLWRLL